MNYNKLQRMHLNSMCHPNTGYDSILLNFRYCLHFQWEVFHWRLQSVLVHVQLLPQAKRNSTPSQLRTNWLAQNFLTANYRKFSDPYNCCHWWYSFKSKSRY